MKAYFLCTITGPQIILTSYDFIKDPACLKELDNRGISKFIAHEVPLELARARYGTHFEAVCRDPNQTDELRILDEGGERVLNNFGFKELGPAIYYEPG